MPLSEIDAWCRITGTKLRRWEIDALGRMEQVRLLWLNRDKPPAEEQTGSRPLTPELFDALFG